MPLPILLAQAPAPPASHESTVTVALLVVILGAIVAISVAWGRLSARADRLERDMEESVKDRAKLREDASKDRTDVREVRTSLGHIVALLDDVRKAVGAGAQGRAG